MCIGETGISAGDEIKTLDNISEFMVAMATDPLIVHEARKSALQTKQCIMYIVVQKCHITVLQY